jgi:hypothetical protein
VNPPGHVPQAPLSPPELPLLDALPLLEPVPLLDPAPLLEPVPLLDPVPLLEPVPLLDAPLLAPEEPPPEDDEVPPPPELEEPQPPAPAATATTTAIERHDRRAWARMGGCLTTKFREWRRRQIQTYLRRPRRIGPSRDR